MKNGRHQLPCIHNTGVFFKGGNYMPPWELLLCVCVCALGSRWTCRHTPLYLGSMLLWVSSRHSRRPTLLSSQTALPAELLLGLVSSFCSYKFCINFLFVKEYILYFWSIVFVCCWHCDDVVNSQQQYMHANTDTGRCTEKFEISSSLWRYKGMLLPRNRLYKEM